MALASQPKSPSVTNPRSMDESKPAQLPSSTENKEEEDKRLRNAVAVTVSESHTKSNSPSTVSEKSAAEGASGEDDVPDGGLTAWLTVSGGILVQMVCGYVTAFGVYEDFFVRGFLDDFSSSQISWIGSGSQFILMTMGFFSGRLLDRGHFYLLYITGSVLVTLSIFTLSLARQQQYYQVFLTLGLGYGLGAGAIYVPGVAIVAQHFSTKRALVMGIVVSGGSLGAIVYPIVLNNLIHGRVGFANGVRVSAGMLAACLLLAGLMMRPRYPKKIVQHRSIVQSMRVFAHDRIYLIANAATFFYIQGFFFPIFYIQLFSNERGLNPVFGFYSLTILSAGSFAGRLMGGAAVNPFGVLNTVILCSAASTVLIFAMFGLINIAGVTVFSIIYGFFSGAFLTLLGPMWASMATDRTEIGERIGVAYIFTGIGTLIGTPISGALLTRDFLWWRPIVYAGSVSGVGTILFVLARHLKVKESGARRC